MKTPKDIASQENNIAILVELTSAFEGIASMKISQIKNQVLQSTEFFNSLWSIYKQIHLDQDFSFGRNYNKIPLTRNLCIIITAEGGFSGDIDQKLVKVFLDQYDANKQDIIVIGHHGAVQLAQLGIAYKKYFKLPTKDKNINVLPLIREVQQYEATTVFYQEYVSLMRQEVKSIELLSVVKQKGEENDKYKDNVINESTYIFEPSAAIVAAYLEQTMVQIALSQLILNSKLAQYASRFRAMSASHMRANNEKNDLHLLLNRTRRSIKDERLKEMVNGLKKSSSYGANR